MRDFCMMWEQAGEEDIAIGGMDTVPENEINDYMMGLLIANADEFTHGRSRRAKQADIVEAESV